MTTGKLVLKIFAKVNFEASNFHSSSFTHAYLVLKTAILMHQIGIVKSQLNTVYLPEKLNFHFPTFILGLKSMRWNSLKSRFAGES